MDNKFDLLKQLGFSDNFISSLEKDNQINVSVSLEELKSNSDELPVFPVDLNNIVIEKTEKPQSIYYIIN